MYVYVCVCACMTTPSCQGIIKQLIAGDILLAIFLPYTINIAGEEVCSSPNTVARFNCIINIRSRKKQKRKTQIILNYGDPLT